MFISVNLLTKYVIHALRSVHKKLGVSIKAVPKNGSGIPNCFRCQTFHLASEPGLSHHGCPSHPSHLSHPSHASHSSHPSHPSHTSHSSYPSHSGHPCHLSHPSHPIVLVVQVIPVILVTLARRMQIFHQ